jgi:CRP-like cAMP-binding protein
VSIDEDIAILEQVPMLRALGRNALRMIALGAEAREIRPGDILFHPGERIDCAYVVQDGTFLLNDAQHPGSAVAVGPGTMLGEFALLAENAQPPSATAQDYAVVIRISRSMFLKILSDDADASLRLRDHVALRARQSIAEILEVRYTLDPGEGGER